MADLGLMSLFMALGLSAFSVVGSIVGKVRGIPALVESARYATYLLVLVLGVATLSLIGAFVSRDFEVAYVARHSNLAMPGYLTWVAFYAGNEGSLLFIAFALAILSALATALAPQRVQASLPYTTAVLMLVLTFFLAVTGFMANPFDKLAVIPADGQGINPLLTHPGMFIHPPMLMTGLIATTVPLAFAMGALLSGKTGDEWVDPGRVWGLLAWGMLGLGLLLGSWWAYTILGWGGFWFWDPVENAAFMPWLGLTAFVHSIMVQKRRGMFRMWNIALINIAFGLALFGMFMNRGGPVPSVHSFGASTIGWVFLMFLAFGVVVPFAIFFWRYGRLKSAQVLESNLSREAAFLVNNLLLLSIAFITMWGMVFPLISQLFTGETITIARPFYDKVNGPLMLALIFLMGVGPLLPWRHGSLKTLKNAVFLPGLMSLAVVVFLLVIGVRKPYALAAFGLCALVASGILLEWTRGTLSRHRRGEGYVVAFARLIAANRPRYGGYVVHLAVVTFALGVVGTSFYNVQRDVILQPGERTEVGGYQLEYVDTDIVQRSDRTEFVSTVNVYREGSFLYRLKPQRAFYPSFRMAATRAAIHSTPIEDLYVVPSENLEDGGVGFRILVNPLAWWMWVSGFVLLLGGMIALWPQRRPALRRVAQPQRSALPSLAGSD